ncbi:lipase [Actinomadura barringtoniae]|uniref:Lipase n=1 Tax=Actinomadura barringtoniae TaxID=1427535 RepID=A0A939PF44_9ACTN|nr:lipase family protein [Actinomadura barringtoniae]MBO2448968.1 lipase [Actinomadura barringtoniae]
MRTNWTRRLLGAMSTVVLGVGALSPVARAATTTEATAAKAPATQAATTQAPATAEDDPFYAAPAGMADAKPGTVLRSRPVQLAAFSALPQKVSAWQLLYRTTGWDGSAQAMVTTVLLPAGRPAGDKRALLSYQVAQDSSTARCAPSKVLRQGAGLEGLINQAEILLVDAAAAKGWAVSIPDYEGPNGEFGAARQPGYAALDGVRAAQNFKPLGLDGARTPVGMWGYSGGSLATGWAAEMQPSYAPELNVKGVAAGGFATDLRAALEKINGGFAAGLIPSALPGIMHAFPKTGAVVNAALNAKGKQILAKAAGKCVTENVLSNPFLNVNDMTTRPLPQILDDPQVAADLKEAGLGQRTPAAPLYIYHAINDELIPVAGADKTVAGYCARGTSVTYERDMLSEHGSLAVTGAPAALHWLQNQIEGTPAPKGCRRADVVSTLATPEALQQFGALLLADLQALAGLPIGTSRW